MPPEILLRAETPAVAATPFLAVLVPQGSLPESLDPLDRAVGGELRRLYAAGDFTGRRDEIAMLYPGGNAARVVLVGTGPASELGMRGLRRAAAAAAKRARAMGVPAAALFAAPEATAAVSDRDTIQGLAEGLLFGAWQFTDLKRPADPPRPPLERLEILAAPGPEATRGLELGRAIGCGQWFARDIQVLPGNQCTPSFLGDTAARLAAGHGIACTVLDRAAIERERMGGLLGVARGSAEEPRFIVLEYAGAEGPPVVLVGKGVTFDSGGISIKPAQSMEDMKYDMSGAAAVLGTFEMLGRLRPRVHVVGLVPATENLPSGTALKPGDVIRSHLGKTIEVINTDAEGRLILCDALSYARRFAPACVMDIATLTGAIVVALGNNATGLFGTDERLLEEVRAAGERGDERVWPLPLWDEYRDLMKSDIADVKNSGGRPAGSITAAWFLREFVEGFPWAHLDIAGTAYSDREDATRVKGPTGVGVRLFSELVLGRAS